jgi:predicted nucleic acid-binding protein
MTGIPDLVFIDTNILTYAYDLRNEGKRKLAIAIIEKLWREGTGVVSTQVLQEFYRVATQKMNPAMSHEEARAIIWGYGEWCSVETDAQLLVSASLLHERHNVQWWDAIVLAGAMRSGAKTLLSEDMQHGQQFGLVTVRNPFVED